MGHPHPIHIHINRKQYRLDDPVQTGASLKQLAGIPLADVLFLQQPGDDEVIANEATVTLKDGDHLHSQPPADYGLDSAALAEAGLDPSRVALHPAPDGWTMLVLRDYTLPESYRPRAVDLLIKLPPAFPDAAPDMFWVRPAVQTACAAAPKGTSTERVLDDSWQRFSWHLAAGAWQPGVSTLKDFLRCIRARFLRAD